MLDNGTFIPDRFTHNGEIASFTLDQMNARPHPDAYYLERIPGLPPRQPDPTTGSRKVRRGIAPLGRPIAGAITDAAAHRRRRALVETATRIAKGHALKGTDYRSYTVLPNGAIHFLATPQDYIDANEMFTDVVGDIYAMARGSDY